MIRHVLPGVDLDAELAALQAALVAEASEIWVVPAGSVSAQVLGRADAELVLEGADDGVVTVTGGALQVTGVVAGAVDLVLDGPLELTGDTVRLERVQVQASLAGSGIAIDATGDHVELVEVTAEATASGAAMGIRVRAATLRVDGLVASADGDGARGADLAATTEAVLTEVDASASGGAAEAVGLRAQSAELELVQVRVTDVDGATAVGIELMATGTILALDLLSRRVLGADAGLGLVALAGGDLDLRGLTVSRVEGAAAHGLIASGAGAIAVSSGRVERVRAGGAAASGVRVLPADPLAAVRVADLHIEAVGAVSPRAVARPPEAWTAWAQAEITTLSAGVPGSLGRPALPAGEAASDCAGLHVHAEATLPAVRAAGEVPAVLVEDLVVYRVGGTALQVSAGFRPLALSRVALWASARAGWVDSEAADLEAITAHAHLLPLHLGPGVYDLVGLLLTGCPGESTPTRHADAEYDDLVNNWSDTDRDAFRPLDALPYRVAGPAVPGSAADGDIPPQAFVDLRLRPALSPADPAPGAFPVLIDDRCVLHDPRPDSIDPLPAPEPRGPDVDYLTRDEEGFFALMRERAVVSMPSWTDGSPADFTWMLFEALAHRLDQLAYGQERAVAEGFLATARLRGSIEDHVRPLDYVADPGLSATTLLWISIDLDALDDVIDELGEVDGADAIALRATLASPYELPREILVTTPDPSDRAVLFETEEALLWSAELDAVPLFEDCAAGATSAVLEGHRETLEVGRWLVLSRGPSLPGHAVRVTSVVLEADRTTITWDPRRPTTASYPADGDDERDLPPTVVLGNVVPAHHGVTLRPGAPRPLTRAWEEALIFDVEPATTEATLPPRPVSVRTSGYPLPGAHRTGVPMIEVAVDGERWTRVDDLALSGLGDEHYALRTAPGGLPAIRFGRHGNGSDLSDTVPTQLTVEATVGLGERGNVGANTLVRLMRFGTDRDVAEELWALGPEPAVDATTWHDRKQHRDDLIARVFRVTNPLPAVGGRDPEDAERIRYRAPLLVRRAISAVTLSDLEDRLADLPEVLGARARDLQTGLRDLVRVTVLLRDLDTLPEAEVLRRWAVVRQTVERVRLVGLDVEIVPPTWVPLDLDLSVDAADWADADAVRRGVESAIAGNGGLLDPDRVGLGGDIHLAHVLQAAQGVEGVAAARVLRMRRLEIDAIEYKDSGTLPIGAHEVATAGGDWLPSDTRAAFTVTVCGGRA